MYQLFMEIKTMSNSQSNPLAKHFRQPIIYLKLPSEGRWYPEGAVELPITGEIPVYAMTAKDELILKTPDALLNGSSTVQVIQSCCPNIKDAWKMPAVDLDPVLIAIRLATYGNEMEFTTACPHCGTKNEKAMDLTYLLDQITMGDWSTAAHWEDLHIQLKPQSYEDFNTASKLNFEEQRIMQIISNDEITDEEKTRQFDEMFARLIDTGVDQISKSIDYILLPDGQRVSNQEHIAEFLTNCDKKVWDAIKERLDEIKADSNYSKVDMVCENEECQKEFTSPFVFEQTNFFG